MTEVMIKHLLVTWFRNEPSAVNPDENQRLEKISRQGEVVDIDDEASFERLEELGAFYTDEERKAIEEGTYDGPDAEAVYRARGQTPATTAAPEGAAGELASGEMSVEELAEHINENNLNVEQTVALAGDDEDSINKVLDAENLATDNEPRKGVVTALEAKLAAV